MTEELNVEWDEVPTCPLCGSEKHERFHTYIPNKRPITHWRLCPECGHVFCSPRPTDEWLAGWYKHGYRMMSYGTEDPDAVPPLAVQDEILRAIRACHTLLRTVRKVKRAIDIGSSTGVLLAGLLDKFRINEAYGVEPNDAWRTFAENRTRDAIEEGYKDAIRFVTTLKQVPKSPLFDLVTMNHVLEHVSDPLGLLRLVRDKYLRKDGHVLIETPRLFGGRADPMLFPHIQCFHHDTLIRLVTDAGFYPLIFETSAGQYQKAPAYLAPNAIVVVASVKKQPYSVDGLMERYNLYREHTLTTMMQLKDAQAQGMAYAEG